MNVLVIGSGGRENAICWKIAESSYCTKLYCAPGNPGTARYAENVNIALDDINSLLDFAKKNQIDLTVVGPELPLTLGIVDLFESNNLKIFGPTKAGAELEGSKSFTKDVLVKANVPTAKYEVFMSYQAASAALKTWDAPLVVKADGLAAGKGVVVCLNNSEVVPALKYAFEKLKSDRVVVEDFLEGVEASFIVATDGENIVPLAPAHDYKRIFDNDKGANTGGMGTVCPTPRMTEEQGRWTVENVIRPTLKELKNRGIVYKGFMYAGLMISPQGEISVIEYNARLGDPETQVILRRLESDLLEILAKLSGVEAFSPRTLDVKWREASAVCVVLASAGYPESSSSGDVINGLENAEKIPNSLVFHAGTKISEKGELVTAGGRVLNVTSLGATLKEAQTNTYKAVELITFDGMQARRDIGNC